jgi:hypothetical protein
VIRDEHVWAYFVLPLVLVLSGCARSLPRPETWNQWEELFRDCRAGDQRACYWRAISDLDAGRTEEAVKRFEEACAAGVGIACNEEGFIYARGWYGRKVDGAKGVALWARACSLGSKDGCDSWGTGLRDGVGGKADPIGAVAAYEQACKLEDGAGCTNLAAALLKGEGTEKNSTRAIALLRTICARESDNQHSCRVLGSALALGDGVTADVNEGLTLLRRACNIGDAEDCQEAGEVMASVGSKDEAVRYLRTSCKWGRASGCRTLGLRLLEGPDEDGAHEEARAVLKRACERGDKASCDK